MAESFYLKKGDRLPALAATLKQSDGTPVNLTGATVVLYMADSTGSLKIDGASVTVVSAAAGTVSYAWGATDTDTDGNFSAEFVVTIGGLEQTVPSKGAFRVIIAEDLED